MLNTTSKYALQALLVLSKRKEGEFVQVNALSKDSDVPGPYLAKIIKTLAARQIVETRRGISGGVRLHPEARSTTFFEVCQALNDPITADSCLLSKKRCNGEAPCPMHDRWSVLRSQIVKFLHESKINSDRRLDALSG